MRYHPDNICPECYSIPCTPECGVECECDGDHEECQTEDCECSLHGDFEQDFEHVLDAREQALASARGWWD